MVLYSQLVEFWCACLFARKIHSSIRERFSRYRRVYKRVFSKDLCESHNLCAYFITSSWIHFLLFLRFYLVFAVRMYIVKMVVLVFLLLLFLLFISFESWCFHRFFFYVAILFIMDYRYWINIRKNVCIDIKWNKVLKGTLQKCDQATETIKHWKRNMFSNVVWTWGSISSNFNHNHSYDSGIQTVVRGSTK